MNFFDRLKQETASERTAILDVQINQDSPRGRVSRETYLAFLGQAYHHVKNTLPFLLLMANRIPKEKEWLRRVMVEYTTGEIGHDEWILDDIRNAGGDVEAVKNSRPSLAVELMNAFNYDLIMRNNPLGYFGMIFVLENTSIDLADRAAEGMKKSTGLGKECFSYVSSHGSLDIDHTQFVANALNKIEDPADQEDIIHASKVIAHLYAEMFRSLPHVPINCEQQHAAA